MGDVNALLLILGIARLLIACPRFAFLDRATNALSPSRVRHVYDLLSQTPISYISVGDRQPSLLGSHDTLVELRPDGSWSAGPIEPEADRPGEPGGSPAHRLGDSPPAG